MCTSCFCDVVYFVEKLTSDNVCLVQLYLFLESETCIFSSLVGADGALLYSVVITVDRSTPPIFWGFYDH